MGRAGLVRVVRGRSGPVLAGRPVLVDDVWTPLRSLELAGHYGLHETQADEYAEWVVPVRWLANRPLTEAYWEKGLFANQNSACKLRQAFTIDRVTAHFQLRDDPAE